jgi:hypothetical protein
MNSQASNLTCVAFSILNESGTRQFLLAGLRRERKNKRFARHLKGGRDRFLIEAELFKDTYWTLEGVDFLEGC